MEYFSIGEIINVRNIKTMCTAIMAGKELTMKETHILTTDVDTIKVEFLLQI